MAAILGSFLREFGDRRRSDAYNTGHPVKATRTGRTAVAESIVT